jgi:hypothetical protein
MPDEITELRSRIASLERQVTELRQPVPANVTGPPPRPAADPQVRIFHPADTAPIELPDDRKLDRLVAIVLQQYPKYSPDVANPRWRESNITEFHLGVSACFSRIARLNRSDKFDATRDIRYFVDECEDQLRVWGRPMTLRWPQYFCACLASGDVAFTLAGPRVGLRLDSAGRPPVPAWKDILNGRALRSPSPPR